MIEKGVSHIAYFRLDGGSSKLYTQEYVDEKEQEIERLNHKADTYMKIAVARQKRINKAIKYLDKNSFGLGYVEVAKLIDMLKGENNG